MISTPLDSVEVGYDENAEFLLGEVVRSTSKDSDQHIRAKAVATLIKKIGVAPWLQVSMTDVDKRHPGKALLDQPASIIEATAVCAIALGNSVSRKQSSRLLRGLIKAVTVVRKLTSAEAGAALVVLRDPTEKLISRLGQRVGILPGHISWRSTAGLNAVMDFADNVSRCGEAGVAKQVRKIIRSAFAKRLYRPVIKAEASMRMVEVLVRSLRNDTLLAHNWLPLRTQDNNSGLKDWLTILSSPQAVIEWLPAVVDQEKRLDVSSCDDVWWKRKAFLADVMTSLDIQQRQRLSESLAIGLPSVLAAVRCSSLTDRRPSSAAQGQIRKRS